MREVIAFAPVSIANVGPCYDVLGYCLNHLGDIVRATKTEEHQEVRLVEVKGPFAKHLETECVDLLNNCVQIVAEEIWDRYMSRPEYGVDLILYKCLPTQSGLGSSAVSCVATAKAMLSLMGIENQLNLFDVSNCMIEGEERVSGHYYPDNIIPSYFGGFNIISHTWVDKVNAVDFFTVVLLQNVKKSTKAQREAVNNYLLEYVLNPDVSDDTKLERILNYLRFQSRSAGRILNGIITGDLKKVGEAISDPEFNLLEDSRGSTIPNYYKIKEAALKAGAYGCSISGSGPAIFAITANFDDAERIKKAMINAVGNDKSYWLISTLNKEGAIIIDDVESWIKSNKKYHNFWE